MRDDLTVLVQRIHPKADDFEIFEFFSQAGKVRDIRLIRDQRSGKSKGVGYVEFGDAASVIHGAGHTWRTATPCTFHAVHC